MKTKILHELIALAKEGKKFRAKKYEEWCIGKDLA